MDDSSVSCLPMLRISKDFISDDSKLTVSMMKNYWKMLQGGIEK